MADLGAIGYTLHGSGSQCLKSVVGKTTKSNAYVSRRVRLYNRTSGALLDSGFSSIQGSYSLGTPANIVDPCFVVVFDDEVAPLRNAIIRDRVVPT